MNPVYQRGRMEKRGQMRKEILVSGLKFPVQCNVTQQHQAAIADIFIVPHHDVTIFQIILKSTGDILIVSKLDGFHFIEG